MPRVASPPTIPIFPHIFTLPQSPFIFSSPEDFNWPHKHPLSVYARLPFPLPATASPGNMVSPEFSGARPKPSVLSDLFVFLSGSMLALLLVWTFFALMNPGPFPSFSGARDGDGGEGGGAACDPMRAHPDPATPTFYDDPGLSYTVERGIQGWDEKRREWLRLHPSLAAGSADRVVMVTGSQPGPCQNLIGDHLLLRLFKNKADYCRRHGLDLVYNNILLHPRMGSYWAKIPAVRSAMVAHPEAEWIWWVDSDAVVTDMDFRLPLSRYRRHNLVLHGWPELIYANRSWVGLNAGVLLLRNCQWTLDFIDRWSSMGPQTPEFGEWGARMRSALPDKMFPEADDQSGIAYLLLTERERWGEKIYLESEYYFEGYWVEIVGRLENISRAYVEMERMEGRMWRRRRAEKVEGYYGERRVDEMRRWEMERRRPFITHFTGCQPCSGNFNDKMYTAERCWEGMKKAIRFADDQVLRGFGFGRGGSLDSDRVYPLPFDYPA